MYVAQLGKFLETQIFYYVSPTSIPIRNVDANEVDSEKGNPFMMDQPIAQVGDNCQSPIKFRPTKKDLFLMGHRIPMAPKMRVML